MQTQTDCSNLTQWLTVNSAWSDWEWFRWRSKVISRSVRPEAGRRNSKLRDERWNEPRHDKTNEVTVRPAKTQISLGIRPVWSESSLSTWRNIGPLTACLAHSENWSDRADAQVIWVFAGRTCHFVGFVVWRLISLFHWVHYWRRSSSTDCCDWT